MKTERWAVWFLFSGISQKLQIKTNWIVNNFIFFYVVNFISKGFDDDNEHLKNKELIKMISETKTKRLFNMFLSPWPSWQRLLHQISSSLEFFSKKESLIGSMSHFLDERNLFFHYLCLELRTFRSSSESFNDNINELCLQKLYIRNRWIKLFSHKKYFVLEIKSVAQ